MQSPIASPSHAAHSVPTLPWRGRVGEASSGARCEPGWGDRTQADFHPTPPRSLGDPPPPGEGDDGADREKPEKEKADKSHRPTHPRNPRAARVEQHAVHPRAVRTPRLPPRPGLSWRAARLPASLRAAGAGRCARGRQGDGLGRPAGAELRRSAGRCARRRAGAHRLGQCHHRELPPLRPARRQDTRHPRVAGAGSAATGQDQ